MTIVRISTRLVPSHEARTRYRLELSAELSDVSSRRRLGHALRFALRTPALRRALVRAEDRAPLHCRWHLFHRYRTVTTDDGHRSRRCANCGRDDPRVDQPRDDVAWAGVASR